MTVLFNVQKEKNVKNACAIPTSIRKTLYSVYLLIIDFGPNPKHVYSDISPIIVNKAFSQVSVDRIVASTGYMNPGYVVTNES